jgi:hypothetical protein
MPNGRFGPVCACSRRSTICGQGALELVRCVGDEISLGLVALTDGHVLEQRDSRGDSLPAIPNRRSAHVQEKALPVLPSHFEPLGFDSLPAKSAGQRELFELVPGTVGPEDVAANSVQRRTVLNPKHPPRPLVDHDHSAFRGGGDDEAAGHLLDDRRQPRPLLLDLVEPLTALDRAAIDTAGGRGGDSDVPSRRLLTSPHPLPSSCRLRSENPS